MLEAEPRRMSSRDVDWSRVAELVRQRGCTRCRCSRARKPRCLACKPRSDLLSSSHNAYVVLFIIIFFTLTLTLSSQLADSQGYDYHPPLPDTEAGPLGDCAICMDAIERPPEDTSGKPRRRGAQDRASYSLAPCAHLFVRVLCCVWKLSLIDFSYCVR